MFDGALENQNPTPKKTNCGALQSPLSKAGCFTEDAKLAGTDNYQSVQAD